MWESLAVQILDVARGATLTKPLSRWAVYPGPLYRRDCRLIGVHLNAPATVPPGGFGINNGCATLVELPFIVNFTADCYPPANDDGSAPPGAEVTAWSLDFLADCEAIYNALGDAMAAGEFGECSGARLTAQDVAGPDGGTVNMRWLLTIPPY